MSVPSSVTATLPLPEGMDLVLASEPGVRGRCAVAGAGQSVDLRPHAPAPAKSKSKSKTGFDDTVFQAAWTLCESLKVATKPIPLYSWHSDFAYGYGHDMKAHETAQGVVTVCLDLLETARGLNNWCTVPMRKNAHTLLAARACMDCALAVLHHIAAFGDLPPGWMPRPELDVPHDYSMTRETITAAVTAGRLPPPPPGLIEEDLGAARAKAHDAVLADRCAWQASPWSRCGQAAPNATDSPAEHDTAASSIEAIDARYAIITTLVTGEVLEMARAEVRQFLTGCLTALKTEIAKQLAARGDKPRAMATIGHAHIRKCPSLAVFEPVLRHGLLWPEFKNWAYPAWFRTLCGTELKAMLQRIRYLLVSNSPATDASCTAAGGPSCTPKYLLPSCAPLGLWNGL